MPDHLWATGLCDRTPPSVLLGLIERPAWMAEAACRGQGSEAFFPTATGGSHQVQRAREVCGGCPVRVECLDHVLQLDEETGVRTVGIWAGTNEGQRRQIGRQAS